MLGGLYLNSNIVFKEILKISNLKKLFQEIYCKFSLISKFCIFLGGGRNCKILISKQCRNYSHSLVDVYKRQVQFGTERPELLLLVNDY